MKLVRWGAVGAEKPGMVDGEGALRDLSGVIGDVDGDHLDDASLDKLRAMDPTSLPAIAAGARLGPCVARPSKFLCIGLNYADHAAETNSPIPKEPILFMKASTAMVGPHDDVLLPHGVEKADWEVELAFVIGKKATRVKEADALSHIAGYCVVNDVSERAFQIERGGQWVKGKSLDTFGPTGPWLVTRDEVADPQKLALGTDLNGEAVQNGSTATMVFPVAKILSYASHFMTFLPGDIVATGTPPGVGMGMRPQRFLRAGDKLRLWVEGLGEQRQTVRAID